MNDCSLYFLMGITTHSSVCVRPWVAHAARDHRFNSVLLLCWTLPKALEFFCSAYVVLGNRIKWQSCVNVFKLLL